MINVSERDKLMSLLFNRDTKLIDLIFFMAFPGESENITIDDVCREFLNAVSQKEIGNAVVSKTFEDNSPKADVRAIEFM